MKSSKTLPPKLPDFSHVQLPKNTRSNDNQVCNCNLCSQARSHGNFKFKKGRGILKQATCNITDKQDVPKTSGNKRSSIKICDICKQEVGKGINHPKNCTMASSSLNIVKQASRELG